MATAQGLSARISANTPARFTVAFVVTAAALLIARPLSSFASVSAAYLLALSAIAFSTRYCGTWPSVASAALSLVGIDFWFLAPAHSLRIASPTNWSGIALFAVAAAVIIGTGETARREVKRLRKAAGDLGEKVRERTSELRSANQSLRELTAQLMNLQDEERRRIARELHDNAGQALAALAMNLTAVSKDLERLTETAGRVADSAGIVQQMSTDIRTMSYLLHPPLLDEMGLSSALQWYVRGFSERSKIAVELECGDDLDRLPREVETTVFRLVQECLTNIHRHSGSSTADIRVRQKDGQLVVEVSDQGQGIASETLELIESAGTPGVGVRGMRERVRQLGGSFHVSSRIGAGTRVNVNLPAAKAAAVAQPTL